MSDAVEQMLGQIRKFEEERTRLEGDIASLTKKRPGLDRAVLDLQLKLRNVKTPSTEMQIELRNAREAAQGAARGVQSMRAKVAEITGKIAEAQKNIKIIEAFMGKR